MALPSRSRLEENLLGVQQRIAQAALRAGRSPESVRMLAVTKYVGPETAEQLAAAGCQDLGESRPQRLWRLAENWRGPPVRWHLVGRLQRNKVARTLPWTTLIHSVDSERLLDAIESAAARLELRPQVLLEAHLSGEESKQGMSADEIGEVLRGRGRWPHIAIQGLMTMAPLEGGQEAARETFRALRRLRDALRSEETPLAELSMGMSGDFETAIEEGATIVRIGAALFEGVSSDESDESPETGL